MKSNNTPIALLLLLAVASTAFATKCSDHLLSLKSSDGQDSYESSSCTSVFGNFEKHLGDVHGLINQHIKQSFQYSIMASHFETDYENRLGFGKYLDDIADSMWKDAIELVKYAGKRGASVSPLMEDSSTGLRITDLNDAIKPWTEVEALGLALDRFHEVATKVHHIHSATKDTSFADFLENQFVGGHVDRIRQLSGHLTNLVPMVQEVDGKDLALYLFDQSLA